MFKALGWTVAFIVAVFTFVVIVNLLALAFPVAIGVVAIGGFFIAVFIGMWSIAYRAIS